MSTYDYDLFVIGAGSGGARAARMAAAHGVKVAIAEEYRVGGTCVIRGCVPKKLMHYAGRLGEAIEDAAGFGWSVRERHFDWATLIANKDREIDRLNGVYVRLLDKAGVTLFLSRAALEGPHALRLPGENRTVTAKTILVATGGRPTAPEFPGAGHLISSNEAFHLPRLPESAAIIGAGYIAIEFAAIFNSLGVRTTVIYRGSQILRGFDRDLRDGLAEEMRKKGVDIRVDSNVERIDKAGDQYELILKDGDRLQAGLAMAATGRAPNSAGLGLEEAGVALGPRGAVIVDEYSRTCVPNIYAVGDVTDRANLTPVAIDEAMRFVATVYGGRPTPVDYEFVPTAVFSQPELGTVGMTEEAAREQGFEVDLYKARFRPMKHSLSGRDERMLMKLVVDARTDRVLGCHILGPDAAEMVQLLAIPLRMGATKSDLDATMALHPTAAEELVTMREKWRPPTPMTE
jgi:glutathione reductase (NADPH)